MPVIVVRDYVVAEVSLTTGAPLAAGASHDALRPQAVDLPALSVRLGALAAGGGAAGRAWMNAGKHCRPSICIRSSVPSMLQYTRPGAAGHATFMIDGRTYSAG